MSKIVLGLRGIIKLVMILIILFVNSYLGQTIKFTSNSIWEVKPSEHKFSLKLLNKEKKVFELTTKGDTTGLFFTTNEGIQYITDRIKVKINNDSVYSTIYETTDKRKAKVTIKINTNGLINIVFTIVPDKGVNQIGAMITSQKEEGYYGLMERTVDGHQNKSWDTKTNASLNLRGRKVTMMVTPTLGIFEPFYVSTQGYGLMINSVHPGKYDLAATDTTLVKFVFDEKKLDMTVIPGTNMAEIVNPTWLIRKLSC